MHKTHQNKAIQKLEVFKGQLIVVKDEHGRIRQGTIRETLRDLVRVRFKVLGIFNIHHWYSLNDRNVKLTF